MENAAKSPAPPVSKPSPPNQEDIAARAHELWIKAGRPTGQDEYHWHEAERQLLSASQTDDGSPFNSLQQEEPLADPGRGPVPSPSGTGRPRQNKRESRTQ